MCPQFQVAGASRRSSCDRLRQRVARSPVPDVTLDLSVALSAIYDEAAYELSIDYTQQPPPPELSEEVSLWIRDLID